MTVTWTDWVNLGVTADAAHMQVWEDAAGGGTFPIGPAGGALDGTFPNPGLAASVAGDGLAESGNVLSVNVGYGLQVVSDTVQVNSSVIAPLASPALSGVPTAPTAAVSTNTTQLATTAFVQGELGAVAKTNVANVFTADQTVRNELIIQTVGGVEKGRLRESSGELNLWGTDTLSFSSGDSTFDFNGGEIQSADWRGSVIDAAYIHSSIARLASPAFTGVPTATTAAVDTNTTQIATTAYVVGQGYLKSASAASTYQPLDATLIALAGLNSTAGLLVQTGADTFTKRDLAGTSNRITVTNPAGTAGNPTVDISSAYVGQNTITTLGTITTGTWNGSVIHKTVLHGTIAYEDEANTFTGGLQTIQSSAGEILRLRSGGAGSYMSVGLGRTGTDAQIGVPGASGEFVTASAAGDLVVLVTSTASKIHLSSGSAATAEVVIGNAAVTINAATQINSNLAMSSNKITGLAAATANGEAVRFEQAILKTLIDAQGDLIVGDADDLPARLPVGVDGRVLTANSAAGNGLGLSWLEPVSAHVIGLDFAEFTNRRLLNFSGDDFDIMDNAIDNATLVEISSTIPRKNQSNSFSEPQLIILGNPGIPLTIDQFDESNTLIAFKTAGAAVGSIFSASGQLRMLAQASLRLQSAVGQLVLDSDTDINVNSNKIINLAAGTAASNDAARMADISALSSTYQPLDATLTALAGLNTTAGLVVQTGTDTFTKRDIAGTSNRISITNPAGTAGNPTIDISSAYVGQATITTLGTIATGTWQGSVIAAAYIDAAIARLASPTFTGTPAAPTAAVDTNTTQIATTAYVVGQGYLKSATAASTYQPLDATLTALAGLNTTAGLVVQTGTDTFTKRDLAGTSNRITVTNPAGTAGNPTIDISSAYVGQATITTLGTVTTGVWNATALGKSYLPAAVAYEDEANTFAGKVTINTGTIAMEFQNSGNARGTIQALADGLDVIANGGTTNGKLYLNSTGTSDIYLIAGGDIDASSNKIKNLAAGTAASNDAARMVDLDTKAPLASPALTGVPTAPTAAPGTNTTQIATTAYVVASFAPLVSPALTGTPSAPTAAGGTNSTQIATTAFVTGAVGGVSAAIPGETKAYAGLNLPSGYLWTDGSWVSRTTYNTLAGAVTLTANGTTTNGSTTVICAAGAFDGAKATMVINGPGIVPGTTLFASPSPGATSITLSANAIASGTVSLSVMPYGGVLQTNGSTTNGSAVMTGIDSTALSKLAVGDHVLGTGIPAGAKILTKDTATQVTLTANATATATNLMSFAPLTHFQLPDLRGRTIFGADHMGGLAAGRLTPANNRVGLNLGQQEIAAADLPQHTHALGGSTGGPSTANTANPDANHTHTEGAPQSYRFDLSTGGGGQAVYTGVITSTGTVSSWHTHSMQSHTHTLPANTGNNSAPSNTQTKIPPATIMYWIIKT